MVLFALLYGTYKFSDDSAPTTKILRSSSVWRSRQIVSYKNMKEVNSMKKTASKKDQKRQIMAGAIAIILVIAMVLPMVMSAFA